jgi:hypothetical protein
VAVFYEQKDLLVARFFPYYHTRKQIIGSEFRNFTIDYELHQKKLVLG